MSKLDRLKKGAMRKPSIILGENVKNFRTRLGWSQTQLAKFLSVTVPTISKIEAGKSWLTEETLINLSETFHIPVYRFLYSTDQETDLIESLLSKRKALDAANVYFGKDFKKIKL